MQLSLSQPTTTTSTLLDPLCFLSKRTPTQPLHETQGPCDSLCTDEGQHQPLRRSVAGLQYVFVPRTDRPGFVGCWQACNPAAEGVFRPVALGCVLRAEPRPRDLIEEYRAEILGEWPELYDDKIVEQSFVVHPKTPLKKSISSKISSSKKEVNPVQRTSLRKPVELLKKTPVIDIKVDVLRTESDEIVEKPKVPKKKAGYLKPESNSLLPWESTPSRIQNSTKIGPGSSIEETKQLIYEILASKMLPNVFEKFGNPSPENTDLFGDKLPNQVLSQEQAEPQLGETDAAAAKRESDSTGAGRSFKYFGTGGVRALNSPEKSVVRDTNTSKQDTRAPKYIPNRPSKSIFPAFPPQKPQFTPRPLPTQVTQPQQGTTVLVRKVLKQPTERIIGPAPLRRDSISKLSAGSHDPAPLALT